MSSNPDKLNCLELNILYLSSIHVDFVTAIVFEFNVDRSQRSTFEHKQSCGLINNFVIFCFAYFESNSTQVEIFHSFYRNKENDIFSIFI